jgi:hypothetical protein
MRRTLVCLFAVAVLGRLCPAADRESWNRIRYMGGTVSIKPGSYDWDTTLTVTSKPPTVELVIAPSSVFGHQRKVILKASQITAIVYGPGTWQRVAALPGSQVMGKSHGLFGLLGRPFVVPFGLLGIFYRGEDGKAGGVLLSCLGAPGIALALESATGKQPTFAK